MYLLPEEVLSPAIYAGLIRYEDLFINKKGVSFYYF
jgi:hypothetical protein